MTRAERTALSLIQSIADAGFVRFTEHAVEEMIDEHATAGEVLDTIEFADSCEIQVNDRFRIECEALSLIVVVELRDDVVVVTVFGRTSR